MKTLALAQLVKEVRDLQKAYFASGSGRFRDKKILAASKLKEKELDVVVEDIFNPVPVAENRFVDNNAIFNDNDFDCNPY